MNDGNDNPPIDFFRAIPVGDAKPPPPDTAICMDGIVGGVPPDQVIAMALVGVLHQLEQRNDLEVRKLEGVEAALTGLSDTTETVLAELADRLDAHERTHARFAEKTDAMQVFSAALLEKADAYRERLEIVEVERSIREASARKLAEQLNLADTVLEDLADKIEGNAQAVRALLERGNRLELNLERAGFAWESKKENGQ